MFKGRKTAIIKGEVLYEFCYKCIFFTFLKDRIKVILAEEKNKELLA